MKVGEQHSAGITFFLNAGMDQMQEPRTIVFCASMGVHTSVCIWRAEHTLKYCSPGAVHLIRQVLSLAWNSQAG